MYGWPLCQNNKNNQSENFGKIIRSTFKVSVLSGLT